MNMLFGRRRRRRGGRLSGAVAGVATGVGLAYFLDPSRGARRRSQAAQRAGRAVRELEETVEAGARDLSHRAQGIAHEARARVEREHASDDVVAERVRAKLGRLTAHPHAIRVASHDGHVELTGPVLRAEHPQVIRGIRVVRGVRGVEDRLEPHETADVPALQGKPPRRGPVPEVLQARWSPGVRLLAAVAGAVLVLRVVFGRSLSRIPAGVAAAALLGRVLSRSRRGVHPVAAPAAGGRGARAGEQGAEAAAHEGGQRHAVEPGRPVTSEVREVKSSAELEPGHER